MESCTQKVNLPASFRFPFQAPLLLYSTPKHQISQFKVQRKCNTLALWGDYELAARQPPPNLLHYRYARCDLSKIQGTHGSYYLGCGCVFEELQSGGVPSEVGVWGLGLTSKHLAGADG